jgi:hypothetical protein
MSRSECCRDLIKSILPIDARVVLSPSSCSRFPHGGSLATGVVARDCGGTDEEVMTTVRNLNPGWKVAQGFPSLTHVPQAGFLSSHCICQFRARIVYPPHKALSSSSYFDFPLTTGLAPVARAHNVGLLGSWRGRFVHSNNTYVV